MVQLVILFRSTTNGDYSVTQHIVECSSDEQANKIRAELRAQADGRTQLEFFTIHLQKAKE